MLKLGTSISIVVALIAGAVLADTRHTTSYGDTNDSFLIEGIGLGTTESELIRELGEPLSKVELEPVFGDREFEFRYTALTVLTLDGIVDSLRLKEGPYSLDNGFAIGMTRNQVEQRLGLSFEMEDIRLRINKSDCHVTLIFDDRILVEVWVFCEG